MSGPGSSKYEVRSTKYGPEPTASPTQQSAFHTSHSDGRPLVETEGLSRDFTIGESVVHALRDVTVQIGRGELVTIQGRSGSGKTTLLTLLGGLDRPTAG